MARPRLFSEDEAGQPTYMLKRNAEPVSFAVQQVTKKISGRFHKTGFAIDTALSPDGRHAAWLYTDSIVVCNINARNSTYEPLPEIKISSDKGWKTVVLAGDYVSAWGHSDSMAMKMVGSSLDELLWNLNSYFGSYI
jgi:hypothetical protein